jgi:uncharacterized membrane protein
MCVMWRWILPALVAALVAFGTYQATLLATPYALMYAAMRKIGADRPANGFYFAPMTTTANQSIVRPSPDLSYSTCVFDLSQGPVLVDINPVVGHYWSVSVFDARTDVAAVRSDRDTQGQPARLALIKKGQKAPEDYEAVSIGYDRGLVLVRILLANPAEFVRVDAARRKSTCKQI